MPCPPGFAHLGLGSVVAMQQGVLGLLELRREASLGEATVTVRGRATVTVRVTVTVRRAWGRDSEGHGQGGFSSSNCCSICVRGWVRHLCVVQGPLGLRLHGDGMREGRRANPF